MATHWQDLSETLLEGGLDFLGLFLVLHESVHPQKLFFDLLGNLSERGSSTTGLCDAQDGHVNALVAL